MGVAKADMASGGPPPRPGFCVEFNHSCPSGGAFTLVLMKQSARRVPILCVPGMVEKLETFQEEGPDENPRILELGTILSVLLPPSRKTLPFPPNTRSLGLHLNTSGGEELTTYQESQSTWAQQFLVTYFVIRTGFSGKTHSG